MALLAFGAFVPLLACILYLSLGGAMADAIEAQFGYNLGTYANVAKASTFEAARHFVTFFSRGTVAIPLLFSMLALWCLRRDKLIVAQLLAWFFAALIAVVAQGKYYDSHWSGIFPPLVFCGALGLYIFWSETKPATNARLVAGLAPVVFFILVSASPVFNFGRTAVLAAGASRLQHYGLFQLHLYNVADEVSTADYIRENSAPTDGLFVWGNDATIHFLANRTNPTRFNFDLPLIVAGPDRDRFRDEAMAAMTRQPPKFIVHGLQWDEKINKEQSLAGFPQFRDFLTTRYEHHKTFGNLYLYRRLDKPG